MKSRSSRKNRLDSWKEIAAYLRRNIDTVILWEKQGLPIHRIGGGAVHAYTDEIDDWLVNGPGGRLGSLREIAAHLNRDVRTVKRWEKEGLPVHRISRGVSGPFRDEIFAYRSEIDDWLDSRAKKQMAEKFASDPSRLDIVPDFSITFDETLSPDQAKTTLQALADYYRVCGGVGLEIDFEIEDVRVAEPEHV
jgi:phage terminase Nu1 subunit (DNA packaging protein)